MSIAPGSTVVFTAQSVPPTSKPGIPPVWTTSDPVNAPIAVSEDGMSCRVAVPKEAVAGSFTLTMTYTNRHNGVVARGTVTEQITATGPLDEVTGFKVELQSADAVNQVAINEKPQAAGYAGTADERYAQQFGHSNAGAIQPEDFGSGTGRYGTDADHWTRSESPTGEDYPGSYGVGPATLHPAFLKPGDQVHILQADGSTGSAIYSVKSIDGDIVHFDGTDTVYHRDHVVRVNAPVEGQPV